MRVHACSIWSVTKYGILMCTFSLSWLSLSARMFEMSLETAAKSGDCLIHLEGQDEMPSMLAAFDTRCFYGDAIAFQYDGNLQRLMGVCFVCVVCGLFVCVCVCMHVCMLV